MKMEKSLIVESIARHIFIIRGEKVMLDADLARLYGVKTKSLNLAVRRNRIRFPGDFMFRLTSKEVENLRFQFETSSLIHPVGWGGRRYKPLVFTEQGVAMLSSVLNSRRAIRVNLMIMRAFVKMRSVLLNKKEFANMLKLIRDRLNNHDRKLKMHQHEMKNLFEILNSLVLKESKSGNKIGFHA